MYFSDEELFEDGDDVFRDFASQTLIPVETLAQRTANPQAVAQISTPIISPPIWRPSPPALPPPAIRPRNEKPAAPQPPPKGQPKSQKYALMTEAKSNRWFEDFSIVKAIYKHRRRGVTKAWSSLRAQGLFPDIVGPAALRRRYDRIRSSFAQYSQKELTGQLGCPPQEYAHAAELIREMDLDAVKQLQSPRSASRLHAPPEGSTPSPLISAAEILQERKKRADLVEKYLTGELHFIGGASPDSQGANSRQ